MSTGSSTQKRGQLVEYGEYLAKQLGQARLRIKMLDLITALVVVVVAAGAYVLTLSVLDQLFVLSTTVRLTSLAIFLCISLLYIVFAMAIPATQRINDLYVAREVENAVPNSKNSLLNWMLLRNRRSEIPPTIMRAIEAKAASDLSKIPIQDAIQAKHLLHASYVLASVVVLFCLYTFTTNKELGPTLQRVLMPLAEVAPPTETKLVDIQPGSTSITAGDNVTVSAMVSGAQPQNVRMYYQSENDDYWVPEDLARPTQEFGNWQTTIHEVQRSFRYYLTANDFKSPVYDIQVTAAPLVEEYHVTYHYPAYTGQEVFQVAKGDIDAVEGTQVRVDVTTNLPAKSGWLVLKIGDKPQQFEMKHVDDASNRLFAEFTLTESGNYHVDFTDYKGVHPKMMPVKNITVRKDTRPEVQFVEPAEPRVLVPANQGVNLRLQATDDYGLAEIAIRMQRSGASEMLDEWKLTGDAETPLGLSRLMVQHVDLNQYGLREGDVIEYWGEAVDNKRPTPNSQDTRLSEPRQLVVTAPVKKQESEPQPQPDSKAPAEEPNQEPNEQPGEKKPTPQSKEQPEQPERNQKQDQQAEPGQGQKESKPQAPNEDQQRLERLRQLLEEEQKQAEQQQQKQQPQKRDGKQEGKPQNNQQNQQKPQNKQQQGDQQNASDQPQDGGSDAGQPGQKSESKPGSQPGSQSEPSETGKGENQSDAEKKSLPEGTKEGQPKGEPQPGSKEQNQADSKPSSDRSQPKQPSEKQSQSKEGKDAKQSNEAGGSEKQTPEKGASNAEQKDEKSSKATKPGEQKNGENQQDAKKQMEPGADSKSEKSETSKAQDNVAQKQAEEDAGADSPQEKNAGEPGADGKENKTGASEKQKAAPGDEKAESKSVPKESPDAEKNESNGKSGPTNQQSQEKGEEKKTVGDPDRSELPSDQKATNPEKSNNPAEGSSAPGQDPSKPDAAQKGQGGEKSGEKTQGKSSDDKPKPEGESESDPEKKPAHKEGDENAAANKQGNEDGQSSQGDKSQKGQSSTGSPSDQKGDNSNSAGEQEGKGQTPSQKDGDEAPSQQKGQQGQQEQKQENQQGQQQNPQGQQGQQQQGQQQNQQGQQGGQQGQQQNQQGQQGQQQGQQNQQGQQPNEQGRQGGGEQQGENKPDGEGMNQPAGKEPGQDPGGESKEKPQEPDKQEGEPKTPEAKDDASSKSGGQGSTTPKPQQGGQGGGGEGGSDIVDNTGDAANEADRQKASSLNYALKNAAEGRNTDPELLKKMGMTQDEFTEFAKRVLEPKQSPTQPDEPAVPLDAQQRQFGGQPQIRTSAVRGAGKTAQDDQRSLFGGSRVAPPPEYRKLFEAYSKSIGKVQQPPPPAAPQQ